MKIVIEEIKEIKEGQKIGFRCVIKDSGKQIDSVKDCIDSLKGLIKSCVEIDKE